LAQNANAYLRADVSGTLSSQGFNLIGVTNYSSGWVASDLGGDMATPLDPKLGPLANNGGPTPTMALLSGSPAIDRGSSAGTATDQRGRLRPIDNFEIPNASGGDGSDIGAFELQPQPIGLAAEPKVNGDVAITFLSEIGRSYRIERRDSLDAAPWTTLSNNVTGTGSLVQVVDPGGGSLPARFYRGLTLP
jgi:hypothetical protein